MAVCNSHIPQVSVKDATVREMKELLDTCVENLEGGETPADVKILTGEIKTQMLEAIHKAKINRVID